MPRNPEEDRLSPEEREDRERQMIQAPTPGPLPSMPTVDLTDDMLFKIETGETVTWGEIKRRLAPTAPVEASGSELHPATADLVDRFAAELKSKLAKAEAKYGYAADWLNTDWQDELSDSLAEHIQKGDPRDVAAYCAFAWHHGWSIAPDINWKAEWEAVSGLRVRDRAAVAQMVSEIVLDLKVRGYVSHAGDPNWCKEAAGWERIVGRNLATPLVPAQDDDKPRKLDVTEDEVAVLLEVMAYAGDEVANAGAANSLFLKVEALSVDLKSTATKEGGE